MPKLAHCLLKKEHLTRRRPRTFPLLHPLTMQAILEVLLKVLDHAERQSRVHLSRAVIAADARQVHDFAAFGGARAGRGRLRRADDGVGAGGDEVGFHEGFEVGVWVAVAEDGDTGVEPGGRTGLWEGWVSFCE
jgi:hypothetical protein